MSGDKAKPSKPSKGAPSSKKGGKEAKKGGVALGGERPRLPGDYVPRLQSHYQDKVRDALTKRFQYKNPMQIPRLTKIVVNVGAGDAVANPRILDGVVREVAQITGQRPAITKARKSISNFKLREGMPIGAFVTLRRHMMWEFLDRLISTAAPRIRDFRGLPNRGFDGRGNYTVGFKEQIIFPEIDLDAIEKIRGMDVTFVTTAKTDVEAYELLKELGLPMRRREQKTPTTEAEAA
ncbi:50S ribosomal protein L5 [bacterium]|nr:50S ribosomal protein L5 [bacterium]MBU1984431.1 50S ribosomal protein L5 [bacterium]